MQKKISAVDVENAECEIPEKKTWNISMIFIWNTTKQPV